MFGLRKTLVLSTLLLSAFSSPTYPPNNDLVDWDQFNALLDNLDSDAIHHALHSMQKFKDGVFSKDRSAIEQVHSENPVIASKLVKIAKRQSGSNSTTTAAASTSPSTPAQSSEAAASSSRASSVSSVLSSAIQASSVPSPTTILVAPTTPQSATPIATSAGHVVFSTIGGGLVTLTSSAEGVSFTPSTSTHLFYTTLPDGHVSTSTSVVVVNAPVTAGGGDALGATGTDSAAATTSGSPGLQSAASPRPASSFMTEVLMLLGGAATWMLAL